MRARRKAHLDPNRDICYRSEELGAHPTLVLNADYRPLSYYPLSLWKWQESVKAVFLDRVTILAEYEKAIHSPSMAIKIPSVIVLRDYIKPAKQVAFTRFNLFLRDEFTCQYCGTRGEMTFDHVLPRSKGGRTTWENVVASCGPCNLRKSNKQLKQTALHLKKRPRKPTVGELMNAGRKFPPNYLHESWRDYLYWDAELEE